MWTRIFWFCLYKYEIEDGYREDFIQQRFPGLSWRGYDWWLGINWTDLRRIVERKASMFLMTWRMASAKLQMCQYLPCSLRRFIIWFYIPSMQNISYFSLKIRFMQLFWFVTYCLLINSWKKAKTIYLLIFLCVQCFTK